MNTAASVALISAHVVVRDGLRDVIDDDPLLRVCASAGTGQRALRAILAEPPDVVVIDPRLPDLPGLRLMQAIARRLPDIRWLVLSCDTAGTEVIHALRSGAHGYLTTDSAGLELRQAIRCVLIGGCYLSEAAALALLDELPIGARWSQPASVFAHLSLRERRLMVEVVAGTEPAELAERLSLSPGAVDSHRGRMMRKLGVQDCAGLLRLAALNGIMAAA